MKLSNVLEAKYQPGPKEAIKFLKSCIENERDYLGDEGDEEDEAVIWALEEIIDEVKAGKIQTQDDLETVGREIYNATAGDGMYGDTDLSDNIQIELGKLLNIQ